MAHKESVSSLRLIDGDPIRTRAALGLAISHCTIVLQSEKMRHEVWARQPYWEPSPASDESLYHVDEVVHEELEYEEWVNQVWAAVLSMLNGAANLSKLFYGAGMGNARKDPHYEWRERQRDQLRTLLKPGPALNAASRVTRDAFEHIDERLWIRLHAIVEGAVDPEVIRYATGSREDWKTYVSEPPLGLYDPADGRVWFWQRDGQEVSTDLRVLAREVGELKARAIETRRFIATT